MTDPITRKMRRQWALVPLAALLVYAGMCTPAEKPEQVATSETQGPTAEEIAAAEAAERAEQERLAEIAAAERELEEREARLAAAEEELARERAREAERRRLASERAAATERERQLAERQRELERKERELEERQLAENATDFEPGTGAGPAGEVREAGGREGSGRNEPWRQLPAEGGEAEVTAEADLEPEAAEPATASLQPGKVLEVEIEETLTSRTARVGDRFSGRLLQDLRNADGVLVIPAGAEVIGRVTEVEPLKRVGGQASLGVEFTEIIVPPAQRIGIRASFVELGADRRKDKRKIAAGAVAGAILGHILGGDGSKNVLIGAAVGAAAGTAVVARAKDKDAEIPAGERLALQLEEVVTVQIRFGEPAS